MDNIETRIQGSEKLTNIFGYWPDFHDAEVIELHFSRGDMNPDEGRYDLPVLTISIHLWEWANTAEPPGGSVRRHRTLATLRFADIDNFRMEGFNHQNAIMELFIEHLERADGLVSYFSVELEPATGMSVSFHCARIEVVDARPCDSRGGPTA